MSYVFKQSFVSTSKYSIKCPNSMTPKYVVCHNTANDASAENEISYMVNNNNQVSYHLAVDDIQAIQGVPFDRNAWHSGDEANGEGNRHGIAVEICYSKSGGPKYTAAEENAVYVMARLLHQYGLSINDLKQHADFAAKNCPHRIRDEGRWESVKARVQTVLTAIKKGECSASLSSGTTSVSSSSSTSSPTVTESKFTVKIICDTLNIRKSASFSSDVVGTVKKGEVFTIVETSNGLGRLKSGAGWISMGTAYVEKTTTSSSSEPTSPGYIVEIVNCSVLNVRSGAGTNYSVVTTVKAGEFYTIVAESNGWGKLKSGAGWISLSYAQKI